MKTIVYLVIAYAVFKIFFDKKEEFPDYSAAAPTVPDLPPTGPSYG